MSGALPAVIFVGGAAYFLADQAPPAQLPPIGGDGVNSPGFNPYSSYFGLDRNAPDGAAAKVDALLQVAEHKFGEMSDAEKTVAAQQLNTQLNLQPPLTGRETWQQVAAVAGGAAASGLCSQIPGIGMAAGPLCAIAGSYVGVQLESWIASSLDDVKQWINNNVPGVVGGWLDSAADAFNNWLKSLGNG